MLFSFLIYGLGFWWLTRILLVWLNPKPSKKRDRAKRDGARGVSKDKTLLSLKKQLKRFPSLAHKEEVGPQASVSFSEAPNILSEEPSVSKQPRRPPLQNAFIWKEILGPAKAATKEKI